MRSIKHRLRSAVILLLTLFALPMVLAEFSPAQACSCRKMTRQQAIGETDYVFEGKVLRVRREGSVVYADIETSRIVKGAVPRVVEVSTPAAGTACGYPFKPGTRLTVGAQMSQQMFSTSSCTMRPLNDP